MLMDSFEKIGFHTMFKYDEIIDGYQDENYYREIYTPV
jgi:hypothetical protein